MVVDQAPQTDRAIDPGAGSSEEGPGQSRAPPRSRCTARWQMVQGGTTPPAPQAVPGASTTSVVRPVSSSTSAELARTSSVGYRLLRSSRRRCPARARFTTRPRLSVTRSKLAFVSLLRTPSMLTGRTAPHLTGLHVRSADPPASPRAGLTLARVGFDYFEVGTDVGGTRRYGGGGGVSSALPLAHLKTSRTPTRLTSGPVPARVPTSRTLAARRLLQRLRQALEGFPEQDRLPHRGGRGLGRGRRDRDRDAPAQRQRPQPRLRHSWRPTPH